jgi:nucleotide-binding universal stress UspA family protein
MTRAVVACADRSPAGLRALRWAGAEARRRGLPLTVVAEPQQARRKRQSAFAGALAAVRAAVPALPVLSGPSGESVPATLRRLSIGAAALVVPATLDGLATVVADAYCPVVAVPADDPSPKTVRGPVVLGAAPWTAVPVLELAFQEAADRGATLHAVRAWSDPRIDIGWLRPDRIAEWDGAEERARCELEHALSAWRIIHPGVPVETIVVEDHPADLLVALSHHAQLLVLGRSSRSALLAGIAGSTVDVLLRSAACPVLVVPDREPSRTAWLPTSGRARELTGP